MKKCNSDLENNIVRLQLLESDRSFVWRRQCGDDPLIYLHRLETAKGRVCKGRDLSPGQSIRVVHEPRMYLYCHPSHEIKLISHMSARWAQSVDPSPIIRFSLLALSSSQTTSLLYEARHMLRNRFTTFFVFINSCYVYLIAISFVPIYLL